MMAGSEVLSARVEDGVALVTLGSPTRIFFDPEMSDALLEAMTALAGDEAVRVLVVTGGAPGYFVRHYSVAALISMGERLKGSGQQWSEDTPYTPGSFAKAMRLAEQMPKPVIAAISGTAMGGGFEFTLACDIRIAQQGDFQIGLPEVNIGILPGGGGTQRLPRVIGTPAALMHILMGVTLSPVEGICPRGRCWKSTGPRDGDRQPPCIPYPATHSRYQTAHPKCCGNAAGSRLAAGAQPIHGLMRRGRGDCTDAHLRE